MDAPPEKEDSAAFIKIATLLRTNNLHAPKIITSDRHMPNSDQLFHC
jgi:aminoglycoside/choline kinase family phosphotransferase